MPTPSPLHPVCNVHASLLPRCARFSRVASFITALSAWQALTPAQKASLNDRPARTPLALAASKEAASVARRPPASISKKKPSSQGSAHATESATETASVASMYQFKAPAAADRAAAVAADGPSPAAVADSTADTSTAACSDSTSDLSSACHESSTRSTSPGRWAEVRCLPAHCPRWHTSDESVAAAPVLGVPCEWKLEAEG
eukprot:4830581-Pleurochrysis_carterae.AAC.1